MKTKIIKILHPGSLLKKASLCLLGLVLILISLSKSPSMDIGILILQLWGIVGGMSLICISLIEFGDIYEKVEVVVK